MPETTEHSAYLLTWNPKYYTPDRELREMELHGNCFSHWTTVSRQMQHGDKLYLMRQGKEPRGIVAFGSARPSIGAERLFTFHRGRWYISLIWHWWRPEEPVFTLDDLNMLFPDQHWSPRGSGIRIEPPVDAELADLIEKALEEERTLQNS